MTSSYGVGASVSWRDKTPARPQAYAEEMNRRFGTDCFVVESEEKPDFRPRPHAHEWEWAIKSVTITQIEEDSPAMDCPDITAPLNIKRTALIETLQANLDKAEAERLERVEAEKENRGKVEELLAENPLKVLGYLRRQFGRSTWAALYESIEETFEGDGLLPKESVPTTHENDLAKFVRVLKLSADETIEVTPDQPIYELL